MAGSRFADDDGRPSPRIAGVVLAAGAGTRFGGPKALATHPDGTPWLATAIRALADAGCSPVLVVLGASADEAAALLGPLPEADRAVVVRADDWARGMSSSLRAALRAAAALDPPPVALAVVPVDVPDLDAATVRRVLDAAAVDPTTLRQAVFGGRPGHPALIGRDHWEPLAAEVRGDAGARSYFDAHDALLVETADLTSGADVDRRL
ncbi:molybdenum cofactor cytidylyltransferase [Clavibacter michiganensis]|uniref:nucleotidyltransferase family protein n=1 Tax=Clavibacter michiganensis TaxID=28447 RepID=UPI001AE63A95|nr:nucleotidyltransferase family protein [Clavibacter michiganensis]MBP2458639.1 molybdenum cofactor cytidylyltransferase [Clavibacter michiganensis]MDQ0411211.1 molybdenum cofactor cytidylyltransferase [Clavibacter michiganensis]